MTNNKRRLQRAWESLTAEEESTLWAKYKQQQSAAAKSSLVTLYLPFAHMLAAKLYAKRYHNEVEFADYAQFAALGLIEAVERFDPALKLAFTTYAPHRINGAMLNGLDGYTESQQQRSFRRRIKDRIESIVPEATASKSEANQAFERIAAVAIGLAVGMMLEGEGVYVEDDETVSPHTPYSALELQQLQGKVVALVDQLPDREALVIRCHYLHQLPFDDIGQMLGVSRGRVSQLHKAALEQLRTLLSQTAVTDLAW